MKTRGMALILPGVIRDAHDKEQTFFLNGTKVLSLLRVRWNTHDRGLGLLALVCTFAVLSILAALFQGGRPGLYLAGEVAAQDVVADRDILVEDEQATQARREQLIAVQPRIFDVDKASILRFREETLTLLRTAEQAADIASSLSEKKIPRIRRISPFIRRRFAEEQQAF